ncbi:DUF3078 domain-containing protein [Lacinutrix sp. Hel_I_90]|uniref:DUF3078 domain-containing protein n=1 Tax=Lacinutrix sp. Hel_I_90 TaxID=1249999 RepID=UPI0005CA3957|nr:DUF3078 domain-containing protein [Lacinutrix sp. Hel_I_90]
MNKVVLLMAIAFAQLVLAQSPIVTVKNDTVNLKSNDSLKVTSPWKQTNVGTLDINEVTFVNWNAGGSNSISALTGLVSNLKYKYKQLKWNNLMRVRYGINKQENQKIRKTEDEFELSSTLGYRKDTITNWYYSARFNFKTQLTNGYSYPDRDNEISRLMAPGYLFVGGGAEYGKNLEKLSLYLSPLTIKGTFVLDKTLSNAGAFGVAPAVYDAEGNVLQDGERVRTEMGILLTSTFETELFENIQLRNVFSSYTDYLKDFGNIDIDWELVLNLKVNHYVRATLGSHIKYDNDIKIQQETVVEDEFVQRGAKIQWKQLLGVGVIVEFS